MIPKKLISIMTSDPYYKKCARLKDGGCSGRITWEHAMTYGGKQIQERWAIIPLCEKHHGVLRWSGSDSLLNKGINRCIALNRATDEELRKYDKSSFIRDRTNLNKFHKNKYKL